MEQDNGLRICEEGKVVVLNWIVKVRLTEKVSFEERLERGEGRGQMPSGGRSFQAEYSWCKAWRWGHAYCV